MSAEATITVGKNNGDGKTSVNVVWAIYVYVYSSRSTVKGKKPDMAKRYPRIITIEKLRVAIKMFVLWIIQRAVSEVNPAVHSPSILPVESATDSTPFTQ